MGTVLNRCIYGTCTDFGTNYHLVIEQKARNFPAAFYDRQDITKTRGKRFSAGTNKPKLPRSWPI